VYDVQARLEEKHRLEEDELYRQIVDERQHQMERLEEVLRREKERTVKELIVWFEEHAALKKERQDGLEKVSSTHLSNIYRKQAPPTCLTFRESKLHPLVLHSVKVSSTHLSYIYRK